MSSNPAQPPSHLPDHLAGYANELAAAQRRLGASADDLAALLDLIIQKPTTRDQLCDLLEKSWEDSPQDFQSGYTRLLQDFLF